LADSRSLPATVLAGVWRVVAGSIVDGPVVGRFVVGEATFHGAGTSHGGTAFRGEAGFHGAPAGCCQITSWSGKGAGGSLSHDRHRLPRPSLSPDTHPTRRLHSCAFHRRVHRPLVISSGSGTRGRCCYQAGRTESD